MSWNRYVAPFSCSLWLAVATAVCILIVCLALTKYSHEKNQGLTVPAIIFFIHSCFCQQGQKAFLLYELFLQSFMIFLFSSSSVLAIFLFLILTLFSRLFRLIIAVLQLYYLFVLNIILLFLFPSLYVCIIGFCRNSLSYAYNKLSSLRVM